MARKSCYDEGAQGAVSDFTKKLPRGCVRRPKTLAVRSHLAKTSAMQYE